MDDNFQPFFLLLCSLSVAVVISGIAILIPISFFYNWGDFIKAILVLAGLLGFGVITIMTTMCLLGIKDDLF